MAAYVRLLGAPAVRQENGWLGLPPGKTSALLYYLAYQESWVSRDDLLYLLWPDMPEQAARQNLRPLLHKLRRLPYTQGLEVEATRLRWPVESDAKAFKQAASERDWPQALNHYEGELLKGFSLGGAPEFESWLELERNELQSGWREAAMSFSNDLEATQRYPEAAQVLERLYKSDLLDEGVLRHYLRLLHLAGERHKSLTVFDSFRKMLQEELATEPELDTLELVEHIRSGAVPERAAERTIAPPGQENHQLRMPLQATPFIGRDSERTELGAQLHDPACRLLTILGPGGIGKTRLAVEVAREQLDAFQNGVFFVNFVPVASADLMVYTIANAAGFSFFGQQEPKEQLLDYLKNKELLLVLDNLEQLLSGIHLVSNLLEHAPNLKLLATSRERLNLQAEWVYDLHGLAVPEAGEEEAQAYDAVKLFAQRASSARHDFILDDASLPSIVRICQLLRGMPLAIELAASWLRSLTLEEIALEIEKGIFFLESSARDVPARHRSIRAVFDYSWQLLTDEEQAVLRKLAVFRGGFRREAAAKVTGATLPILASLVDKSFLTFTPAGRYRRHPLVIQYTQEKLSEHPEEQARAEEKHGFYHLHLLQHQAGNLKSLGRKEALSYLEAEVPNISAAWRWAVEHEQVELLKLTAEPLFWHLTTERPLEVVDLFAFAASRLSDTHPDHQTALGRVLTELAFTLMVLGRREVGLEAAERGLALVKAARDDEGTLRGLSVLAQSKWMYSDFLQSKLAAEEGLELARQLAREDYIGRFLERLALVLKEFDDLPNVERFYRDGLAEIRQLNTNPQLLAGYLHQYAFYLLHHGDLHEAQALEQEGLKLFTELSLRGAQIGCLDCLGMIAFKLGDLDEADPLLQDALTIADDMRFSFAQAYVLSNLGKLATVKGDYALAEQHLKRSFESGLNAKNTFNLAATLVSFAELRIAQGQPTEAAPWLALAAHHPGAERHDRMEAQRELEHLQEKLSPQELEAALERGKELELEELVGKLLKTL